MRARKLGALILALVMVFSLAAAGAAEAAPKDGAYTYYNARGPYTLRADVTVEGGIVAAVALEEFHNPSFWTTLSEAEIEAMDDSVYATVENANGRLTYFGRYATVGVGEEAIAWTAADEPADNGLGTLQFVYSAEGLGDFTSWMADQANAAWYEEQLWAGNYWVTDADGNPIHDLATYIVNRRDGVVIPKEQSRFKSYNRHWTAVGTGFGSEHGDKGWSGNMQAIIDFVVEHQFPQGEFAYNDDGLVTVADVVSSVSLTSGVAWYFPVVYAAYEMALAE